MPGDVVSPAAAVLLRPIVQRQYVAGFLKRPNVNCSERLCSRLRRGESSPGGIQTQAIVVHDLLLR